MRIGHVGSQLHFQRMASAHQSSPSRHETGMGDLPTLEFDFHFPSTNDFGDADISFRYRERIDSEEIHVGGFVPPRKTSEGGASELFRSSPRWEGSVAGAIFERGNFQAPKGIVHSLVVPTAT